MQKIVVTRLYRPSAVENIHLVGILSATNLSPALFMQASSTINGWLIKQGGSKVCPLSNLLAPPLLQRAASCFVPHTSAHRFFCAGWLQNLEKALVCAEPGRADVLRAALTYQLLSCINLTHVRYYAQPSRKDLKGVMNITDCVVEHSPPAQVHCSRRSAARNHACMF